jgi:ABC-2 type transport system permease protein
MAVLQAGVACAVAFGLLDLTILGPTWMVVVLAVLNAMLGMSLGLFLSAFASTEFQAVQFMPAFLLPQLLLCGLIADRDGMAAPLRWLSDFLPMTYAYDALHRVATSDTVTSRVLADMAVVLGVTLLALALGAATLRRRTD